ncbi:sensor domain-containing diguanylate cyclase [Halopseudomonas salina]|uniref:diguanylate cyclase n=1 Tax=Halopseudomonas salina TaxID=1323744 RepID=A0ABQ1Q1F0_9GAMM|nr:diguanylate cyclase [Halopseudomonas salina]GGD10368.1 deoxynucleoside kinase [Halopseudomonas salina]
MRWIRLILYWLLALSTAPLAAEPPQPLILSPGQSLFSLNTHIEYLEDKEGQLGIDALLASGLEWQPPKREVLSFGFTSSTYWVRFTVSRELTDNSPATPYVLVIGNAILDWVDVYIYENGSLAAHHSLGDKLPHAQRLLDYPHFAVPLKLQQSDTTTVYLRVRSSSSVLIPLHIYSNQHLVERSYERAVAQALFYGAMLVMALYNLLILKSIRDVSYFYYAMMVLSTAVVFGGIEGISFKYLWPDATWLNDVVPIMSVASLVAFAALFFRSFLLLPQTRPFLGRLALGFVYASALIMAGAFILPYQQMMMLAVLLAIGGIICAVWAGFARWLDGFHGAWVFNLAWGCLLVVGMLLALTSLGILPLEWFSMRITQIGAGLQAVLLSFALAHRMRFEKRMAALARQDAAKAQQKMLEHQIQANENLDRIVLERTLELEKTHAKLREISTTDGLTRLLNRRAFDDVFLTEYRNAHRCQRPLAVLMIDLDHFKRINDNYGHSFGDLCLVRTAEVIRACLRHSADIAARYGGEEFIVLLPETDIENAVAVAQLIMDALSRSLVTDEQHQLRVSASIGVASGVPKELTDQEALLREADRQLYLAKENGRNTIEWQKN